MTVCGFLMQKSGEDCSRWGALEEALCVGLIDEHLLKRATWQEALNDYRNFEK